LRTCPKSYISADSIGLVEEFAFRRRTGSIAVAELTARQAEAFALLEAALMEEWKHARQDTRSTAR
jgi:hypothetical protein